MKVCKECKTYLPLAEFHPNKSCSDGVVGTCRVCTNRRKASWYARNRALRQERANRANQARKATWVAEKGGKCHDCGGVFHQCVYDFHHIDGTKEVNPSKALTWSAERARVELDKCVLLCSNCHRLRHFTEGCTVDTPKEGSAHDRPN